MTTYHVHLYREMRLYFPGIEASSPEEAAQIAADQPTAEAEQIHDCDGETLSALVDVQGDDEYRQSVNIYFEAERLRQLAHKLLEALVALRPYAEAEAQAREAHRGEDALMDQEADEAWHALEQADAAIAQASLQSSPLGQRKT